MEPEITPHIQATVEILMEIMIMETIQAHHQMAAVIIIVMAVLLKELKTQLIMELTISKIN